LEPSIFTIFNNFINLIWFINLTKATIPPSVSTNLLQLVTISVYQWIYVKKR